MWWWQTSWVEYWTLTMISFGVILSLGLVIAGLAFVIRRRRSGRAPLVVPTEATYEDVAVSNERRTAA